MSDEPIYHIHFAYEAGIKVRDNRRMDLVDPSGPPPSISSLPDRLPKVNFSDRPAVRVGPRKRFEVSTKAYTGPIPQDILDFDATVRSQAQ